VRCLHHDFLGGRHFEGRDLILQVTKFCQCRHRIATSLKDSFTFKLAKRRNQAREADRTKPAKRRTSPRSNEPARGATNQPAEQRPARGATTSPRSNDQPAEQRPARGATTSPRSNDQPAKQRPREATTPRSNDPARGAGDSIKPGAPAPGSRLEKRLSPRSGRQRKTSTGCRPLRGLNRYGIAILGLRSQSLAPPQALCCRPLRGLS
jgi:hypothetical protein